MIFPPHGFAKVCHNVSITIRHNSEGQLLSVNWEDGGQADSDSQGTPSSPSSQPPSPGGGSGAAKTVMQPALVEKLVSSGAVPAHFAVNDWELVYSSNIHGSSLGTFFANTEKLESGSVLLIKTDTYEIFGAYVSDPWRRKHAGYYGRGETCVFSLVPGPISVHKHTGENDFYVHSDADGITIGGGSLGAAICLDKSLQHGTTGDCLTFGNKVTTATAAAAAFPVPSPSLQQTHIFSVP